MGKQLTLQGWLEGVGVGSELYSSAVLLGYQRSITVYPQERYGRGPETTYSAAHHALVYRRLCCVYQRFRQIYQRKLLFIGAVFTFIGGNRTFIGKTIFYPLQVHPPGADIHAFKTVKTS
ncbi:hypothetical protein FZC84_15835 [Rossellomorea vietnamensis]|uniref:Uncharacterized protein n=1 Tax=Rossellomorea vietnamensis TaxID=218284 RepID=A0A5D4MAV0_9BACI|nr:hypothetical protein [Rossellomorea vietnamensis]TYR98090.1 hypothetical protein FZC84_15835 [Rossellomorea vietnamensis]